MRATLHFLLVTVLSALPPAFAAEAPSPAGTPGGVIRGSVSAGAKSCQSGAAEVFVSDGPTLIYQAEVPIGGTFEFHLVPGRYNLVIISSAGCSAETEVKLAVGGSAPLKLSLEPQKKGAGQ